MEIRLKQAKKLQEIADNGELFAKYQRQEME